MSLTRRHLLIAAATLAATCVISTTVFWIELANDASWHGGKLVVYNAVFFITAIGALVCLVVGLRTPRTPTTGSRVAGAGRLLRLVGRLRLVNRGHRAKDPLDRRSSQWLV